MGEQTAISWTDHTFNPWWGCVKVSPACAHCYAETFSKRIGLKVWGPDSERRFFGPKHWKEPLKWNASAAKAGVRRRVFCASMADVFEDRPDVYQARLDLFLTIEETPALDWLLLTKRPDDIRRLLPGWWNGRPWPNVWLGTTGEDDEWMIPRLDALLDVPAVVHFLSYEPALGPLTALRRYTSRTERDHRLDWVIAGGESGHGARSPQIAWFRDVRDQCAFDGVAFHFKQWGGLHPKTNGRLLDGREWNEFPRAQSCAP